jgi:uncharacterized protein
LVHISALADKFVKDPHTVVKAGQVVKVKVLEVDEKRKRIALTMRLTDSAGQVGNRSDAAPREQRDNRPQARPTSGKTLNRAPAQAPVGGAMAAAFAKLKA